MPGPSPLEIVATVTITFIVFARADIWLGWIVSLARLLGE